MRRLSTLTRTCALVREVSRLPSSVRIAYYQTIDHSQPVLTVQRKSIKTASLSFGYVLAVTTSAPPAPDYADMACQGEAHSAQAIAQDRDAGVSKENELRRILLQSQQMPYETGMRARAELPRFVEGLYGKYANVPAAQVYPKYLAYCRQQVAKGRGQ
ncbi:MAG TPA: hypothetical protein VF534_22465 [Paraburkholderia sp.]